MTTMDNGKYLYRSDCNIFADSSFGDSALINNDKDRLANIYGPSYDYHNVEKSTNMPYGTQLTSLYGKYQPTYASKNSVVPLPTVNISVCDATKEPNVAHSFASGVNPSTSDMPSCNKSFLASLDRFGEQMMSDISANNDFQLSKEITNYSTDGLQDSSNDPNLANLLPPPVTKFMEFTNNVSGSSSSSSNTSTVIDSGGGYDEDEIIVSPGIEMNLSGPPSPKNIQANNLKVRKPKKKRKPHNVIEKRYRSKINDRMVHLKQLVPSLRITYKKEEGIPLVEQDAIDLDGLQPAKKLNKASILMKAIEYIIHLESKCSALSSELNRKNYV